MSTVASIVLAIGVVLWRAYEDRLAATDRAGIKARQPAAFMSLVWFATQAQQEFMGLNDGTTETWEYWLVAAMAAAIAIQLALTRR